MAKRSRNSQRLKLRDVTPARQARVRGRGFRLAAIGAAIAAVVALLAAATIAFSAAFGTFNTTGLPPGTQVFAENDHAHVTGSVTYDRVPPAGGPHNPTQLNCGVYTQPVPNENAVHSLEHGAVWITYQPTLSADQVAALQQLVTSNYVGSQRYVILSPMPACRHRSWPAPGERSWQSATLRTAGWSLSSTTSPAGRREESPAVLAPEAWVTRWSEPSPTPSISDDLRPPSLSRRGEAYQAAGGRPSAPR